MTSAAHVPDCRESQVPFVVLQPPFEEFKPLVQRPEERRHEPVQVKGDAPSLRKAYTAPCCILLRLCARLSSIRQHRMRRCT